MSAEQQQPIQTIHKAERTDVARLDIMVAGMAASKDFGYFERQFNYQDQGKRNVFIIQSDGLDAGYGILNWDPKYELFRKIGIPEVQDINILKHFRQQGLATNLITFCEDLARETGKDFMGIGVSVSSRFGPAQRLYTKLGYIPDGYGVTYDRKNTVSGEMRPVDDQLCLMMIKAL
ncbi:MAG: GNAT family N-acetyltransferase [Pseudomonadota bacterium]